ncbi:hypothetical protein LPJ64_005542 [Coemansia asiatica]|uniref:Uncharacterized protein n=1 Tax=Coemansia asiatica TaxID=1052880 RepID=A0A9W7XH22_9FUNG|nr:hypothetical protein LPJ64_005542 [Coemansia asiatica]
MKFAFTAALVVSAAAVAQAANENALAQISQHWDAIVSVINGDLPTLKGLNPDIYAQATSVIGGTSLDASYNEQLVQQVATGISPAIMNPVLERAGVTGVTLDGSPLPTAGVETGSSDAGSSEASQESSTQEDTASASSTPSSSDSQQSSSPLSDASSDASSSGSSDSSDASSSEDESSDKSDSSEEEEEESSKSSGAGKLAAGSIVAAVAVVAALF